MRSSKNGRVVPSEYRIVLLLEMPIPNFNTILTCHMNVEVVHCNLFSALGVKLKLICSSSSLS